MATCRWAFVLTVLLVGKVGAQGRSHAPMRALPVASKRPLSASRLYFVDTVRGDDAQVGSKTKPWQTVRFASRQLKAGDTLVLRGGTYYESISLPIAGTKEEPITVRSYPGELVVIDGGFREFYDAPEKAWQPYEGGAQHEFVSASKYPQFLDDPVDMAFPAAGWEPFYGKPEQRPVVLGHFGDSMVPLHGYRTLIDLRDDSMLWDVDNKFQKEQGVYCGPGLWFNRNTQRIHIRLAPTNLLGLGKRSYRGETDPRRLRLCISGPFGRDVLRINGGRHLIIQDLVLRGASSSPLINLYGADDIVLDGITAYGGSPGLLIKATSQLRIVNSVFRAMVFKSQHEIPWHALLSVD